MNILGVSGLHNSVPFKKAAFPNLSPRHYRIVQGLDAAAALVTPDGIQAAAAEERFSRAKGTEAFPAQAMRYCLQASQLTPDEIDYVAHSFSYEPYRALYEQSDSALIQKQFAEVYARKAQLRMLKQHFPSVDWTPRFIQVPHHLAHAASTFYVSGFEEALILVTDGMGEMHSTTVAIGSGTDIQILKQVPGLHSLGIFYGVLTLYLGFWMGWDEYKVMGLAAYGNPRRYFSQLMDLIRLKDDGTYAIPILYRNTTIEEKETYAGTLRALTERFGPPRAPQRPITHRHKDLAAALQSALQESLMHILRHFQRETGQAHLCMAGGVALNCAANGVIKRSGLFDHLFVQPAAADDGSALGAALYAYHLQDPSQCFDAMTLPLWGPCYDTQAIETALQPRPECDYTRFPSFADLATDVARRLAEGRLIGWFQGRMEFGPRALGNRSILADPRDPDMKARINRRAKKREPFRPFAPAVLADAASQFFDIEPGDEFAHAHMLFVTPVWAGRQDDLPAVTHIDGSARVQTVAREHQPRFWSLLREFGRLSGVPVLLNTSFNVRGQPIVCTPTEALDTFIEANLDALVIGDYLVTRSEQSLDRRTTKSENRPINATDAAM